MKLNEIVTSLETSQLLNRVGFVNKSIFSYYKNEEGHIYLSETDLSNHEFISYAYTSCELISYLPEHIELKEGHFIAERKNYRMLMENDIKDYPFALLVMLKHTISGDEVEYVSKYSFNQSMIALTQNTKGKYNNLIRFGNTEAECRAKMILALIEEEVLNILN